jgi:AraC-like DNA-binding protein
LRVRSACLTHYREVAEACGLDARAQLSAADIDWHCLENPDLMIPAAAVCELLERSAAAAGIEDFGLRMARLRRLSNLGLIALLAREEPSVRAALQSLVRTFHLHNEGMLLVLEEANDAAVIREEFIAAVGGPVRQAAELSVGVTWRMLREFLGPHWRPAAVCFTHPAPRDTRPHQQLFGVRVQFDSVLNGITCRSRELDRAMPAADPESARTIRKLLDATAGGGAPGEIAQVRKLVWSLLATGRCNADTVARHLGVDRRTLHRRLARHGTSFSQLEDGIRAEIVDRRLGERGLALAELGVLLGFSAQSAFTRWFTARYGRSPGAWRRERARTG